MVITKVRPKTGGNKNGSVHSTKEIHDVFKGMHSSGMSQRAIAKKLGVPRSTIQDWIHKLDRTGTTDRVSGSGRPRVTSSTDDQHIILEVKRNRLITTDEIQSNLPTLKCCKETIRNRIKESGEFNSYWQINKPFISEKNRLKRVEWCKDRLHYTIEQWRKFLWTDESPFVLRYNRQKRVWRSQNERYKTFAMKGTVKHDDKIMVWGCFAAHGVGDLYLVDGIMESEQYKRILRDHFKPSAQRLFGGYDYTFQQDNDPKHTSNATRQYMRHLGLDPEEWPKAPI